MTRDPSLYVRYAIISQLKALAVDGVGSNWFPQQVPANQAFPYGFVGVPIAAPDHIQCFNASTIRFAIHAYTQGETVAAQIGMRLAQLDGAELDLTASPVLCPYPAYVDLTWVSNTVIRDAQETTIFHLISQWVAEVTS